MSGLPQEETVRPSVPTGALRPRRIDTGRDVLERHFLFRHLEADARGRIVSYARVRHVAAGETIFLKGSAGTSMMAVVAGQVRISVFSPQGKEIVLNVINPGEVFGEIAVLDGKERSADAVALTKCELLVLERRDLVAFLETNAKACITLLETLCQRVRQTSEQVEDMVFLPLPGRIAKVLLRLTRSDGDRVRMSQRELGVSVGGTRESMNKYLGDLRRRQIIALEEGGIRVCDRAALQAALEEVSGRD
jgi:CRP-like cAMP-binding protein